MRAQWRRMVSATSSLTPAPRRLRCAALQVVRHFQQTLLELLAPRLRAQGAGLGGNAAPAEAVDDHAPRWWRLPQHPASPAPPEVLGAGPRRGSPRHPRNADWRTPSTFTRTAGLAAVGERTPRVDGESAGTQHAGDEGKHARVVGGEYRAGQGLRVTGGRQHHRQGTGAVEPAELADVRHHLRQGELRVVVFPQTRQMGVDELPVDSVELAEEYLAPWLHVTPQGTCCASLRHPRRPETGGAMPAIDMAPAEATV